MTGAQDRGGNSWLERTIAVCLGGRYCKTGTVTRHRETAPFNDKRRVRLTQRLRCVRVLGEIRTISIQAFAAWLLLAAPAAAQTQSMPVSVNIAARTAFAHTRAADADPASEFLLDSVRLLLGGEITQQIKLTFQTEYDGPSNEVRVLDAIGRFEFSPKFNIWMGRFLPPSDRANLYGPYFSNHWSIYTDGVQDGYPFVAGGRANGAAYWGQFGRVSLSGGIFDGPTATGDTTPIEAGRVQVNFWDTEPGYYPNGTYYGGKNIFAVGVAGQVQGGDGKAFSADVLLERKVEGGGAWTVESEFARYSRLGGYNARYATDQGGYVLASYLLPVLTGQGRFQVLGKIARANFADGITAADVDYGQTTTEINVNYIIKGFDARIMVFYLDTRYDAVRTDTKRIGVGIQLQK
jgi:hypothetical protein